MNRPHYAGTLQHSFKQAVRQLLETQYGLIGSGRVLDLLADDLQHLAEQFHPSADHFQRGWLVFTGTKASGPKAHPASVAVTMNSSPWLTCPPVVPLAVS